MMVKILGGGICLCPTKYPMFVKRFGAMTLLSFWMRYVPNPRYTYLQMQKILWQMTYILANNALVSIILPTAIINLPPFKNH
jgi:hypothetical protein